MTRPTIAISVNAAWNLINFRRGLLVQLREAGYRVIAIAPPDGYEMGLADLGVEFIPIAIDRRGTSPLADARLLAAYIAILRRERPAALLSFTIKPNVYGGIACRLLGIPLIANVAGLGTAFLQRGALNFVARRLYAAGLRGARKIFFQNPEDRARFLADRIVDADRTALLPGSGIDLSRFSPRDRTPDGRTVFLLVARLLWAKGLAEYVAAAQALRERHGTHLVFRILGIRDHSSGGVDGGTLAEWEQAGAVEVLGTVDDVRPVLAEADCVVLPSYYPEGTPRSLLEAAALGKPLVTTDTPGCRDVVDDGVNGFLCQPRSATALAAALEHFIGLDPADRKAMGVASRAKAEREFDERLVIDAYLDALTRA